MRLHVFCYPTICRSVPSAILTKSPALIYLVTPFVSEVTLRVQVDAPYAHDSIAISEYPLSGAAALGRLCNAWENHLDIL